MQLHALEPLYTIFYTLVCKNVSSCWLKFSGKIVNKYMENLRQTSGEIWAQLQPQKFASRILCCVALSYNSYFFQNSRFTEISVDANFSFFLLTESPRAITLAWKCLFTSWRFPQKQAPWSIDRTIIIIELGYHKISWFVSVLQVNHLPQPSAPANNLLIYPPLTKQLLDIRFSYKNCYFSRGCQLVKMHGFATVTRSIYCCHPDSCEVGKVLLNLE